MLGQFTIFKRQWIRRGMYAVMLRTFSLVFKDAENILENVNVLNGELKGDMCTDVRGTLFCP